MVFGKVDFHMNRHVDEPGLGLSQSSERIAGYQQTEIRRPGIGQYLDEQKALLDMLVKGLAEMETRLGSILINEEPENLIKDDVDRSVSGVSSVIIKNNMMIHGAIAHLSNMIRRVDL